MMGAPDISHNTWIHRIVEVGVRPLAKTPVTPNQLTTLRLMGGIGAAACFSVGQEFWAIAGSVLFVLSLCLDRADGILARLTGKTTPWGHTYDLIADSASNSLAFVGIGIGLRGGELGLWSIPLGLVAGLAISAVLWLVMRAEDQAGDRAAELESTAGFDPDDAMLAVPAAVLLGWAQPLIIAAAIGATFFALFFFWRFRRFL